LSAARDYHYTFREWCIDNLLDVRYISLTVVLVSQHAFQHATSA